MVPPAAGLPYLQRHDLEQALSPPTGNPLAISLVSLKSIFCLILHYPPSLDGLCFVPYAAVRILFLTKFINNCLVHFFMKYTLYIVALLALFLVVGCTLQTPTYQEQPSTGPAPVVSEGPSEDTNTAAKKTSTKPATKTLSEPTTHLVEVTMTSFSPAVLTVQGGDTVEFKSVKGTHWVASAIHPDHKAYPGSDIWKCNGPEEETIFDACRRISEGKSYSFTFLEKGSWKYHDHVNPRLAGTIVVD